MTRPAMLRVLELSLVGEAVPAMFRPALEFLLRHDELAITGRAATYRVTGKGRERRRVLLEAGVVPAPMPRRVARAAHAGLATTTGDETNRAARQRARRASRRASAGGTAGD